MFRGLYSGDNREKGNYTIRLSILFKDYDEFKNKLVDLELDSATEFTENIYNTLMGIAGEYFTLYTNAEQGRITSALIWDSVWLQYKEYKNFIDSKKLLESSTEINFYEANKSETAKKYLSGGTESINKNSYLAALNQYKEALENKMSPKLFLIMKFIQQVISPIQPTRQAHYSERGNYNDER